MFPNRFPAFSVNPCVVLSILFAFALAGLPSQGQTIPGGAITNADSKLAIKVTVDGQPIDFKGAPPQMQGSRIMVPVRGVFEKLGAQLTWDPSTRTVTAVRGDEKTVLTAGKTDATVNGQVANIGTPPIVAEGRVMVPLRFLAQALGAKVEWMAADRTVVIQTKEAPEPDGSGASTK